MFVTKLIGSWISERFFTAEMDSLEQRRFLVAILIATIGIILLSAFGVSALLQNNVLLGFGDLSTALILGGAVWDAGQHKRFRVNIYIGVVAVTILYIYLYASGLNEKASSLWYLTYPLIACYLLGSRKGIFFSLSMLLPVLAVCFLGPMNDIIETYSINFTIRFIGAYSVIAFFSYLFVTIQEINHKEINAINRSLEGRIKEKTATLVSANRKLVEESKERKRSEKLLLESKEKYRLVAENVTDSIWVLDFDSLEFKYISPAIQGIIGFHPEEVVGTKLENQVTHPSFQRFLNELHRLAGSRTANAIDKNSFIVELEYLHRNGKPVWTEVSVQITSDPAGDPNTILGVTRDITERKRLQNQLEHSNKMHAIGNLAGGIAHDFNNILAAIIGYNELALEKTKEDEDIQEYLNEIDIASKRAKELVWQILTFARKTDEPLKPIQLSKIVNEVLKLLRSTIPASIEIKHSVDSGSVIMGSETQMHQIVLNLCTNATSAMDKQGGVLEVTLKDTTVDGRLPETLTKLEAGKYILLQVSDTGDGISEEIVDLIFEPYFTTKDAGKGTGMGLAVVQGIVDKQGGRVFCESYPGKGSTFSVYLPTSEKRGSIKKLDSTALPTGTENILYVDDETAIAKMVDTILKGLGYTVTAVTSSLQAFEIFQSQPDEFDMIMSDMTMPDMSGDELAAAIKKIRPEIPIILCTGYTNRVTESTITELGISGLLFKPFSKPDIARSIRTVLDEGGM